MLSLLYEHTSAQLEHSQALAVQRTVAGRPCRGTLRCNQRSFLLLFVDTARRYLERPVLLLVHNRRRPAIPSTCAGVDSGLGPLASHMPYRLAEYRSEKYCLPFFICTPTFASAPEQTTQTRAHDLVLGGTHPCHHEIGVRHLAVWREAEAEPPSGLHTSREGDGLGGLDGK